VVREVIPEYDEPDDIPDIKVKMVGEPPDTVNHPPHYNQHPSGIECIQVVEWFNFNLGNAIKYIWRAGDKGGLEDLKKARWYINREIARLEAESERGQ
jgi:hypothetical protein